MRRFANCTAAPQSFSCQARRISVLFLWRLKHADVPSWRWPEVARSKPCVHGETGALVNEPTAEAFAESILATISRSFDAAVIRRHAERFSRERFGDEIEALVRAPQASGLPG